MGIIELCKPCQMKTPGPPQTPPEVGATLQKMRLERNLTLEDLSRAAGVSKSMLSQIEREKANPTIGSKACGARRKRTTPVRAPRVGENQIFQAGPRQGRSSMTQAPKVRAAISGKMISFTLKCSATATMQTTKSIVIYSDLVNTPHPSLYHIKNRSS